MISMIYNKKRGGTVKVHNADMLDSFIEDCFNEKLMETEEMKKKQRHSAKNESRAISTCPSASTLSANSKSQTNRLERSQNWLNQKTIKELQKVNTDHTVAKQPHTQFLETEETFMKELDDFLAQKEITDLRRKELLHKKWTEKVYEPIRKRIISVLDGPGRYSLDNLKRDAHRQFLEHVNKRGFVFLEDDDKQDYYAQVHQPTSVKSKPKAVGDPLHLQKRQRYEEESTILRCMTGHQFSDSDLDQVRLPPLPLVPQGRHGVNSCLWLEMPYRNIDNMSREKSRNWGDNARTSIDFRAWAEQDYDAKVARQELQMPRKRMFKEHPPFGKPSVEIPHVPFIDPEEFSDKIVNTNPFLQHMTNLKAEVSTVHELMPEQQLLPEQQSLPDQQSCEKLKSQQVLSQ